MRQNFQQQKHGCHNSLNWLYCLLDAKFQEKLLKVDNFWKTMLPCHYYHRGATSNRQRERQCQNVRRQMAADVQESRPGRPRVRPTIRIPHNFRNSRNSRSIKKYSSCHQIYSSRGPIIIKQDAQSSERSTVYSWPLFDLQYFFFF